VFITPDHGVVIARRSMSELTQYCIAVNSIEAPSAKVQDSLLGMNYQIRLSWDGDIPKDWQPVGGELVRKPFVHRHWTWQDVYKAVKSLEGK